MTIARTRELLGEEVVGLSDDQVSELIAQSSKFCDIIYDIICSHNLTKKLVNVKNGTKYEE
jgi:hypothetical protein